MVPVKRIAPKPRRCTVRSPSRHVPESAARGEPATLEGEFIEVVTGTSIILFGHGVILCAVLPADPAGNVDVPWALDQGCPDKLPVVEARPGVAASLSCSSLAYLRVACGP